MLFFSVPHTSLKKCFAYFFGYLVSLLFYFYYFYFEFKLWHPCLPQDVCHKLQSNVVTMIFFLPVPFYDLVFSFLSFFLFFPSRSGAPDVKQPRYGFVLFLLQFFWVGNKKNAPFAQTFPPQLFYTNPSFSTHCSFFLPPFTTLPFYSLPLLSCPPHLVDFALSVTLLSCTLAFLPKTRLWPELSRQKVMLFFCLKWWCAVKCHPLLKCCFFESLNRRTSVCVQNAQSLLKLLCCHSHCLASLDSIQQFLPLPIFLESEV